MSHTTPFRYQIEAVQGIERFSGRCLIAYATGSGKSFISLLYAAKHTDLRPVVVVCPSYLKWNWSREASTHVGIRCEILETMTPKEVRIVRPNTIYIVNYDILGPRRTKDRDCLPGWLDFLKDLQPKLVIIDECQFLRNMSTIRTRAVRSLCKDVNHILALSGTPLVNRPAELFPILNILRPDIYKKPHPFYVQFCNLRRTPWGLDIRGAKNLDQLHTNLLEDCMIRKRKEDILKDLPPKSRFIVPLPIQKRKEYLSAVNDFIGWMSRKHPTMAKKAGKAEQISKLNYLKQLVAKLKLESVQDWIDTFLEDSDEKLLVFAFHRSMVKTLHERYEKQSVMVHGGITGKKRQKAFDAFNESKKKRLLIGNILAAGTGWNARDCCTIAFVELGWTPGDMIQAEDRCHGLKRGKGDLPISVYYLIGKDTIEEDLCKILQRKSKIIDATLDGGKVKGSLDIYDELVKQMSKEKE